MDSGGAEETEPLASLPAAGALGPGASTDAPPSSPRNPLPIDLATEGKFGGWASLEDWDNYMTMEEEKLEQRKRQFEEECRVDWAALAESRERKNLFERYLDEISAKLEQDMAQALLERRQIEQRMEENRAKWDQIEADQQLRMEEVERQKRDLDIQKEELNKFVAMQRAQQHKPLPAQSDSSMEEQLQKPLLLRPELKHSKNCNTWDSSPIVCVLIVLIGLALLVAMCTLLPLVYLQYIVGALAVLWGLGSVVLSFRIFERFRGQKTLHHYAARLAFLCFTLLGMYVLYLVSRHLDDISSRASPSSATAQ